MEEHDELKGGRRTTQKYDGGGRTERGVEARPGFKWTTQGGFSKNTPWTTLEIRSFFFRDNSRTQHSKSRASYWKVFMFLGDVMVHHDTSLSHLVPFRFC